MIYSGYKDVDDQKRLFSTSSSSVRDIFIKPPNLLSFYILDIAVETRHFSLNHSQKHVKMISNNFLMAFALYLLCPDIIAAKSIIDGVKPCKRNDPKLDECLLNILKQTKPLLLHGNQELNLPPLDPVLIPSIAIHRSMQDFKASGKLTDLTAKGASSITVRTIKVKLDEKTWDMTLAIPLITFVTDFNLNVTLKALNLPIFGKGKCDGKISRSSILFHANTNVKEGKLFLEDIKINLQLGDVDVHIIKSQNPVLAQTASQFFNSNKRLVLDLVTPLAEDATKDLLLRHGNRILSTMNLTDIIVD